MNATFTTAGARGGRGPNRAPSLRRQRITTLVFALVILIPSGYGFTRKLLELVALTRGDTDGVFAISPVVNYLLASVGFFFLFCWAILNGMFGDIEGPKRKMLETQEMLDEDEDTYGPNGYALEGHRESRDDWD